MNEPRTDYAARVDIDYEPKRDRLTTLFRALLVIPIALIYWLISGQWVGSIFSVRGAENGDSGAIVVSGLVIATALMILVRQRYPRWWFDFLREMVRFAGRLSAYLFLLTDEYPSTVEEQAVHLEIDYPDVERDLNHWLPLVKWLLAIPHFVILAFLAVATLATTVAAWFVILLTGSYPRPLFDFVVGVARWGLRVGAYSMLLVTDDYPPFSLR